MIQSSQKNVIRISKYYFPFESLNQKKLRECSSFSLNIKIAVRNTS